MTHLTISDEFVRNCIFEDLPLLLEQEFLIEDRIAEDFTSTSMCIGEKDWYQCVS